MLLSDQSGYTLVGQVGAREGLADELEIYQADVVVWDMGWEPEESISLLQELAADSDEGAPVLVALIPDGEYAAAVWAAGLQASLRGILLRDVTSKRLLASIQAASEGLATLESDLLDLLLPANSLEDYLSAEDLTPRELEVLQLLAEGLANKTIAQRLEISEHTVKFHVNAIMSKLGAQSRTAAVVRATRMGLIVL
jgi:DNA-binding NarL/FixJ family response regulator